MSDVKNLDLLKPKPHWVQLCGKKIDLSFMPCGIVFDVNDVINELGAIDTKELSAGGKAARQAFDSTIKLCALVTHSQYEEMDEDFLRKVRIDQIQGLAEEIKNLLSRELEAVPKGDNGENPPAAQDA